MFGFDHASFLGLQTPSPASPTLQQEPPYVDGTGSELAKTLYKLGQKNEITPSIAIAQATGMFRQAAARTITAAACTAVEKLAAASRTRSNKEGRATEELTVRQHAEVNKKHLLKTQVERRKFLHKTKKSRTDEQQQEYDSLLESTKKLGEEIHTITYSDDEIVAATERHKRDLSFSTPPKEEDTKHKLKEVWHQMVLALLLQKLKTSATPQDVTFEGASKLSLQPLVLFTEDQKQKCSRLSITPGDSTRQFAEQLQEEQLFCEWLHELSTDRSLSEDKRTKKRAKANASVDQLLFTPLALALSSSQAFLRHTAERDAAPGKRFSALKTMIDNDASFKREHQTPSKTETEDDSARNLKGVLAIGAGRLSRKPGGEATEEEIVETRSTTSKTLFKNRDAHKSAQSAKGGKKVEFESDSDVEERPAQALVLKEAGHKQSDTAPNADSIESIAVQVFAMQTAQKKGVCYAFQKTGTCPNDACSYKHERLQQPLSDPPTTKWAGKRQRSPQRDRSPPQHNEQPREQAKPRRDAPYAKDTRQFRGGKGRDRQREPNFPKQPDSACKEMWDTSNCTNQSCRKLHGLYKASSKVCEARLRKIPCRHLWMEKGCGFDHPFRLLPKND